MAQVRTLRDRCADMLLKLKYSVQPTIHDVEDLMAFVVAEKGRASDSLLLETLPVCLYFGNLEERENFISAIKEAKPNLIAKRMP